MLMFKMVLTKTQFVEFIASLQNEVEVNEILRLGTAEDRSEFVGTDILDTIHDNLIETCMFAVLGTRIAH
jgi:hypothetical protein